MKKIVSLLCASLIVLLMFVAPGNPVQAANECECDITTIIGAEKNKIVSDLLSSDEFKNAKRDILNSGILWDGVHEIEVIKNNTYGGIIIISIPIFTEDGTEMIAGFMDGKFFGVFPSEPHIE